MQGYMQNIEGLTVKNEDFRRVLYTTKQSQLVLMALNPKGEIGTEAHKLSRAMVIFHFSRGGAKVICHPWGQGYLPV